MLSPLLCLLLHLFVSAALPVVDPGEVPPLILRPNWGRKGQKNFFGRPSPPALSKALDDRAPPPPPPPYLHVWIWPCCLLYYASFSTSLLVLHYQWWIQGRPPRSFLDQTGAGRAKKNFFGDQAPPPYLRLWMTGLPPPPPHALISMSGSVTDYRLCVRKTYRYYCVGDLNNPKSITFKSCYLVALE